MKRTLLALAALLALGACGRNAEVQTPEVSLPGCDQAPQQCIGGYLVERDGNRQVAYKVGSDMDPRYVDRYVGNGKGRFYWPDDKDPTGKRVYERQRSG